MTAIDATPVRRTRLPARLQLTRRDLQIVLGMLWLLDGALQFQPFMLRSSFAREIVAPTGDGQPAFVAVPVHWAARLIAAHPVAWDVPFAAVQLLLGIGLLVPRTARLALAASLPWVVGVWFFGEGLSGLASGDASLLSGAPGAVLLYGVLALVAWPAEGRPRSVSWLPFAWATLWLGAALLQVLPDNNSGSAVAGSISTASLARWAAGHGALAVGLLVVVEAAVGIAAVSRRTRAVGALAGFVMALAIWAFAQNFGDLFSGQATDPNSGPLLALLAIALAT